MESIAFFKMDIFFIVTTTVVLLLGIFGVIILYYCIKIVRNINRIIATIQREAEEIAQDFGDVRKDVKAGVREVREGIATATGYTKAVAGAGIVRAVSGLFEAFVEEKEQSKARKKSAKAKKTD
jgi:hypothetical protein